MAGKLKIRVDQDKCQGHARCKSLAPELFDLDEFGNAHEVGDGSVPAGLEDKAWLAQSNCPEIAIEVTEELLQCPIPPASCPNIRRSPTGSTISTTPIRPGRKTRFRSGRNCARLRRSFTPSASSAATCRPPTRR